MVYRKSHREVDAETLYREDAHLVKGFMGRVEVDFRILKKVPGHEYGGISYINIAKKAAGHVVFDKRLKELKLKNNALIIKYLTRDGSKEIRFTVNDTEKIRNALSEVVVADREKMQFS